MHHHRDHTSRHGTAHHRATRNLSWACTLAASHPHKQGAVCLQVNKDQSPFLRAQRSVQRTPELSSREARRFCARDQTYLVRPCPTSPPAAPAKPRPTTPAPSPPPWQLILMRTSSDISKDGLQRTLRNRRLGCVRTSTTWAACTCPSSARR